jgi:UDP-N-acetylglucosamine/UDP-N-acetylgalactosamine diphosphorylase
MRHRGGKRKDTVDVTRCTSLTSTAACRHHIARKHIQSAHGAVPGVKLEQFIFDPFCTVKRACLFEVERSAEFAPVKNASGPGVTDSPATARAALLALHRQWVEAAGGTLASSEGFEEVGIEVAPAVSYGGEGLDTLCAGKQLQAGTEIT